MLILLSQNEQGISALDLQKHIFPSGSSSMKSTFPWMQRHYVNYYKGEHLYETNRREEKCVSADLMHLFLVRFVTVRLTYIFIDHPDCEYIIILNTSIVIYDFWRLSVLRSSTPSMTIFGNRHRQKACLLTNTRMIHTHIFTINMIPM
jgi:hypothetical protein